MKTVQMTLDEGLVEAVDEGARRLGTTRSGFVRKGLRQALTRLRERELEQQHRAGYQRRPVKPEEFDVWEREQVGSTGPVGSRSSSRGNGQSHGPPSISDPPRGEDKERLYEHRESAVLGCGTNSRGEKVAPNSLRTLEEGPSWESPSRRLPGQSHWRPV